MKGSSGACKKYVCVYIYTNSRRKPPYENVRASSSVAPLTRSS